jgi:5-methylcytosine-specific restriction enzyme subunit McrC
MSRGITIYEYDSLVKEGGRADFCADIHGVPENVFQWLASQCSKQPADDDLDSNTKVNWLRWSQKNKHLVIKVTNYVGVIQAPNGFTIEVLPKVGKASLTINAHNTSNTGQVKARKLLVEMLCSLQSFSHVEIDNAKLLASRMPLLDIFIYDFLIKVKGIVTRGLRRSYDLNQDNLFALRGKLLISKNIQINLVRPDRFFTEHDEFSINRPENRLIAAALLVVLKLARFNANQELARELLFSFAEVPASSQIDIDFQKVQIDRDMGYYTQALSWAKIILNNKSPIAGLGKNDAPSLLFPMEKLFESFVGKHLRKQIKPQFQLIKNSSSEYLVEHQKENWFLLKPDFLIKNRNENFLVLDTKWKLIDQTLSNSNKKYGIAQSDFYQMFAYGHNYLKGKGNLVLIYPKTDQFKEPIKVFNFSKNTDLKLWVLPFCLDKENYQLLLPSEVQELREFFVEDDVAISDVLVN